MSPVSLNIRKLLAKDRGVDCGRCSSGGRISRVRDLHWAVSHGDGCPALLCCFPWSKWRVIHTEGVQCWPVRIALWERCQSLTLLPGSLLKGDVLCTHFPRRLPSQSPLQLPYLCCSNTYDTMSRCMVQSFHHMSSISATSQSIGTFLLICFIAHPISHAERVLKVTGTVKVNGTTTSPKLHIAQF